ncbi:hypothetical protein F3S47_01715 [Histidinibacterium aquaticum]|uniref:Uncharacterized protein n=1 Tax=Histidinibacterium aquaticum TaxID=2613962 RepID=A0A5J5GRL5_9RHOB|nr:hypothetical protein F3S47_01715 [Histidinibacterium aquaticum]
MAEAALPSVLALPRGRRLVALAGPPAAGKSTVAQCLWALLLRRGREAVVLPMDGFHLDNRLLERRGLLDRKGAPETFDAAGFAKLIARAVAGEALVFPVFDRERDIAIAGAEELSAETEFVLVEGNYLLLTDPPWSGLAQSWDLAIWIDTAPEELRQRLVDRWIAEGMSTETARRRAESNDIPNANLIRARRGRADLEFIA